MEQIAEAEKVANRFVFLCTHLGEFEGVAPTGKRVEFIGHSIDRVVDDNVDPTFMNPRQLDALGTIRGQAYAEHEFGILCAFGARPSRTSRATTSSSTSRRSRSEQLSDFSYERSLADRWGDSLR